MTPEEQAEFIASLVSGAQATQQQYHIFASVTISQAIFESSWGRSLLTIKANNLFGIKATPDWTGGTFQIQTPEDRADGSQYLVVAAFRKYPDFAASIADHGAFLANNGKPVRYMAALNCTDPASQVQAIAAAGYSTNPQYASMINQEIVARNLTQYDLT